MIRIGIIDSGFRDGARQRPGTACSFLLQDNTVQITRDQAPDLLGHGSEIARLIQEVTRSRYLYIARVFSNRLITSPAQVASALDWLRSRKVALINLSFGLTQDREILRLACAEAIAEGALLVAATPARGKPVFPAAYPGVIRVCGDARCTPEEIAWLDSPLADIGACVRSGVEAIAGSSVACAYVTAIIGRIMAESGIRGEDRIREILHRQSAYLGTEQRG